MWGRKGLEVFYITNTMTDWLKVILKPKSIIGMFVAVGLLMLVLTGIFIPIHKGASDYFFSTCVVILGIGILGWVLYLIPGIARNWSR